MPELMDPPFNFPISDYNKLLCLNTFKVTIDNDDVLISITTGITVNYLLNNNMLIDVPIGSIFITEDSVFPFATKLTIVKRDNTLYLV